jgi:hypothetical protein
MGESMMTSGDLLLETSLLLMILKLFEVRPFFSQSYRSILNLTLSWQSLPGKVKQSHFSFPRKDRQEGNPFFPHEFASDSLSSDFCDGQGSLIHFPIDRREASQQKK